MPRTSPGHRQLNLTFPVALIDAAERTTAARGTTITAEVRKALERLAGFKSPARPRGRPKKNPEKSENT